MLEAKPEAASELAQGAGLLGWLLTRVKTRGFHANKLYASELLAVLLQERYAGDMREMWGRYGGGIGEV